MKKNARHKSEDAVEKCESNSQNALLALRKNPVLCLKQITGPPQDVLPVTGQANQSKRVNQMSGNDHQVQGLPEAAKLFVEEMLRVSPTDPRHRNAEHLLELSQHGKTFSGPPQASLSAVAVVESVPDQWRHHAAQVFLACSSLPPEVRTNVSRGLNSSQVPLGPPPIDPPAQVRQPLANSLLLPVHHPQPNDPPQPSVGQAPAPATVHFLVLVEAHPPRHSISLRDHRFGSKLPAAAQCSFLFQVVVDVLNLGKQDLGEGANRMDLHLGGKKLVNRHDKSAFTRVIDSFFECLEGCCDFDTAVFMQKCPNCTGARFRTRDQCVTCKGSLKKQWRKRRLKKWWKQKPNSKLTAN